MREEMKFRTAVNGFNKSDVMHCIEKLMAEKKEQKKTIKKLEEELQTCKDELDRCSTEAANAKKSDCENCEAAKMAQAQLGAAMLDAKRFSEMLLKDANDKAASVINNAAASVALSTESANMLAEELKQAKDKFNTTLESLQETLSGIILEFMDYQQNLDSQGGDFKYNTDFSGSDK